MQYHFIFCILILQLSVLFSQKLRNQNRLGRTTESSSSFNMEAGGTKFANTTVWAAMIQTDPTVAGVLGRDFHKVPQGVNGTAVDNAWARVEHAKKMTVDLPFNVAFWWSVYAPNCPSRNAKGNDRGVSMAHYQIWADFEFQGRHKRGKDRLIASDRDVLIVFEDDAVIAVKDVNASLEIEISKMNTDLLFLGWCYGRRGMPMCTHAYALTRGAIKKILKEWDSCTISSIDGQWKTMVADGIFTWKKANQNSYKDLREGFGDNPAYFTRGIFVQKNGMVSFNHHGFQNNAG